MTTSERDGFLHRWSRRKVQAREGRLPGDADPGEPQLDPAAGAGRAAGPADARTGAAPPASPQDAPPESPPLTLDDVRALTPDADFAPFVAPRVAPEVKNAALKKLFSDPHYNVMDGLDTYIDDYSNMTPLPAAMLRRLASARALAMFDEAPAAPAEAAAPPAPPPAAIAGEPAQQAAAAPGQDPARPAAKPAASPAAGTATGTAAQAEARPATAPAPGGDSTEPTEPTAPQPAAARGHP